VSAPRLLGVRSGKAQNEHIASALPRPSKRTSELDVARYEVKPDGTVVVVTCKPESAEPENPWLAELRKKETKK